MEEMGKSCKLCKSKIKHIVQNNRSTYFCTTCQRSQSSFFKADSTATWTNFDNFPLYRAISLTIEDDTKVNLSCAAKNTLSISLFFGIDLCWQFETHTQNLT